MTREEIIEGLKLLEDNMVYFDELLNDKGEYIDVHELLFESIEALKQEPCEDAISRQAVLDMVEDMTDQFGNKHRVVTEGMISLLPPVTPKPKTGRWIDSGIYGEIEGQITKAYTCSKCGAISIFRVSDGYIINADNCPNCGAKMESEVPT